MTNIATLEECERELEFANTSILELKTENVNLLKKDTITTC